jgi:hypothetical protein
MADSAGMRIFDAMRRIKTAPKTTGRPPKPSTIASLGKLPKPLQTMSMKPAKAPKLPPPPPAMGAR